MPMKSETLDEARERLKAMSAQEKEGFASASEGQLIPERDPVLDDRAAEVDRQGEQLQEAYTANTLDTARETGDGRTSKPAESAPAPKTAKK